MVARFSGPVRFGAARGAAGRGTAGVGCGVCPRRLSATATGRVTSSLAPDRGALSQALNRTSDLATRGDPTLDNPELRLFALRISLRVPVAGYSRKRQAEDQVIQVLYLNIDGIGNIRL